MASVLNVGKLFSQPIEFLKYLETLEWRSWRPKFVTLHHTGVPTLATWSAWQTRKVPVTDDQWLKNLAGYYGNTMRWSAAPHFFITPRHICVLSPSTARGVHAVEFNAISWGMEMVGNFDTEQFAGPIAEMAVGALAACHIAMGWSPQPFQKSARGLHFHRDDSTTTKTCPGRKIEKASLQALISRRMVQMQTDGGEEHPQETVRSVAVLVRSVEVDVPKDDVLHVRADASARAPVVRSLSAGAVVQVLGEAMNGETKWLSLGQGEWIAARHTREKTAVVTTPVAGSVA